MSSPFWSSMVTGPQISQSLEFLGWGQAWWALLTQSSPENAERSLWVSDFAGREELGGVICAVTVSWHQVWQD